MTATLRMIVLAALAAAPALGGRPGDEGAGPAAPLRATLRATAPLGSPAPPWLERAVCERGVELGEACTGVAGALAQETRRAGVDPVLVLAIIEVESGWDPDAVSSMDAHGLMQLLLPTLGDLAAGGQLPSTDAHDPQVNVRAGIRLFAQMLERFHDPDLALIAYNAGPNRLAAYLEAEQGVPDRFWKYPRFVRRAEQRLRARLEAPAELLASADPLQHAE